jgi:hypothetical protein
MVNFNNPNSLNKWDKQILSNIIHPLSPLQQLSSLPTYKLKSIVNLHDKQIKKINNISTTNPYHLIENNLDVLKKDKIYLHSFNGIKYLSIYDAKRDNKIIEQLTNPTKLSLIWSIYGKGSNNKKNIISKKLGDFNNVGNVGNDFREFLSNVITNITSGNHKKINLENKFNQSNQTGGFLIKLAQTSLDTILSDATSYGVDIILDVIDIGLILLSSVPGIFGLKMPNINLLYDLISIVYSILRMDLVGTVSGIISIIPFYGDIIGGIFGIGTKIGKYIDNHHKYKQFNLKIDMAQEIGFKYGNKYNEIVKFVQKYGDNALKLIIKVVDFGPEHVDIQITKRILHRSNEEEIRKIIILSEKYGNMSIKAGKIGLFLKEHAITNIKKGTQKRYQLVNEHTDKKMVEINKNILV